MFDETEDQELEHWREVSETSLKGELLDPEKARVHSAATSKRRENLRQTVDESLRDLFLDGHRATEDGKQGRSDQFVQYGMRKWVEAGTLDWILAPKFYKWVRSDAIIDAIAQRIAKNSRFL